MDREKLAENILTIVPFMFKKLRKVFPPSGISKQQLELLFHINHEDRKPMNFYSEKMMVPKSNLTVISDKLIMEGLIERVFDPNDRRIIILKITKKGIEYLGEYKKIIIREMKKKLDSLNNDDIKRLNELIGEMKIIFNKIDQ